MRKRETKLHPRRTAILMVVYALLLALGAAMPLAASYSEDAAHAGRAEEAPTNDLRGS